MSRLLLLVAAVSACNYDKAPPATPIDSPPPIDTPSIDAGVDAPLGPFGTAQLLTVAADPTKQEDDGSLSNSGLEFVFSIVDGASGTKHLYWTSRATTTDPFGTPVKTAFASDDTKTDWGVRWSSDDRTLYFASDREPTLGSQDLYMVSHSLAANEWGPPTKITALSGPTSDKWLTTCSGGYYLMSRVDDQGTHIYGGSGFGTAGVTAPALVSELVGSGTSDSSVQLAEDCLTVYFSSTRDGTSDLWTATRATPTSTWNAPTKLTMFSTTNNEQDPWMSPDQRTFIFSSNVNGTFDEWISTR